MIVRSTNNSYAKLAFAKRYRNEKHEYKLNECPKRRPVHVVDIVDDENEDQEYVKEEGEENCIDEVCGEEQGDFVYIVLKILCSPKQEKLAQHWKIFQAKCYSVTLFAV